MPASPNYSFYDPYVRVGIVDRYGTTFMLQPSFLNQSLHVQSGTGLDAPRVNNMLDNIAYDRADMNGLTGFPYVSEVRLVYNLGMYPSISVTLTPPYKDALNFLNSKLPETGNYISLEMGYAYGPGASIRKAQPIYSLMLNPEVSLGADISIMLNAVGPGNFRTARSEGPNRSYKGKTRYEIVEEELKLSSQQNAEFSQKTFSMVQDLSHISDNSVPGGSSQPRLFSPKSGMKDVIKLYTRDKIDFDTGAKTSATVIRKLIEDDCFSTFRVEYDVNETELVEKMVFIPYDSNGRPSERIFALFDLPEEVGVDVFPILGVSSPTVAQAFIPNEMRGIEYRNWDRSLGRTGTPGVTLAEVGPKAADTSNRKTCADPSFSNKTKAQFLAGIEAKEGSRVVAQMQARLERSRIAGGLKIEIDTLGIPDLLPGTPINVRGLSDRFSNENDTYIVHSVDHVYNATGFMTHLVCIGNSNAFLNQDGTRRCRNPIKPPSAAAKPTRREVTKKENEGLLGVKVLFREIDRTKILRHL